MDDIKLGQPRIIEYIRHSIPWTVYDTVWVPLSTRFVAMGSYPRGTGAIQVFQLKEGKIALLHEYKKKTTIKCGTFSHSTIENRTLATGDFEGNLSVYDIEDEANPIYRVEKAHESIINTIDGAGSTFGPPEIVTGSRDGCVKIWDIRQKDKPVASLEPDVNETQADCWAVAFGNSYDDHERVVASGYDNGDLKIFDLRTNTLRWETNIKNGICSLQFDRPDIKMNKLLATTLEGKFMIFDMRTFHPELGYSHMTHKVKQSTIWCGRHSPHNREVFFISTAGNLMLYKYNYPKERKIGVPPRGVLGTVELIHNQNLSTQPILNLDWHKNKEGLAVAACLDQAIRVIIVTKLETLA